MLKVGFVGCGDFAKCFVPLFQKHPLVESVRVCDLDRSRAEGYAARFGVEVVDSFDDMLRSDCNCVAIFTQRHTHGPLVIRALRAGKHVYSAVPMASEVSHCQEIIETVQETGLTYMIGETCWYYPCAMFCREKYRSGEMGRFVYAEAQYYHDISHFPASFRADKRTAGVPPFFYPTHSTAMAVSAVGSFVTQVAAFGYEDREGDGYFGKGTNQWDNPYSNSYSLMKLHNGGTIRINECRRIAWKAPSSSISGFYGTLGGYQFSHAQHVFTKLTPKGVELIDVSDYVNPAEMTRHRGDATFKSDVANHVYQGDSFAPIQDPGRLPPSFRGLPNSHMASHQFLVDDFCRAADKGTIPPVNNAWDAARYTVPGLVAHQSVLAGGVLMDVPDFGDAPIEK